MRFYINIILVAFGFFMLSSFGPKQAKKRAPKLRTLFACKQGGKLRMPAAEFLKVMHQPLCVRDSLDSVYRIVRFELMYAETGLYQDEAGLPIAHTDYTRGVFFGDRLDSNWISLFKEHAYKGDTIKISNVQVKGRDSLKYRSPNIELVLF